MSNLRRVLLQCSNLDSTSDTAWRQKFTKIAHRSRFARQIWVDMSKIESTRHVCNCSGQFYQFLLVVKKETKMIWPQHPVKKH